MRAAAAAVLACCAVHVGVVGAVAGWSIGAWAGVPLAAVTMAVLVMSPGARPPGSRSTTVAVALDPAAKVGVVQLTKPAAGVQVRPPSPGVTPTTSRPAGIWSPSTTSAASDGPALLATRV